MYTTLSWNEAGKSCIAHWRSESGMAPPKRVVVADDTMKADDAYRLACEGTAMLWHGDFQNAKLLLQAMSRRGERKTRKGRKIAELPGEAFHLHRQAQSQRARTLAMILIPLDSDYTVPLRRAPDLRLACTEAYGAAGEPSVASLRELLGMVGAHEWRKKGVEVSEIGARIHPHYGVFSPLRGEYLELVNQAPLPSTELAFDIGTGTGVLAALLARRGVKRIVATDLDPRALTCARENLTGLGLDTQVDVVEADLFPDGCAPLIVCNPPWIPARPSSPIERAIFDPDCSMLRGFVTGLAGHLSPQGEGWLILSDIAEHLGLRTREALLEMFETSGLQVVERMDIIPHHSKVSDESAPLHAARAAEITSLWRLSARSNG
ncbi:MAG: class I SAM-dependent methyltransferase [Gallionella sp.]